MLGIVLIAALLPELIAPFDPNELNVRDRLTSPSSAHFMGTDMFGRDQFSRLVYGARISVQVALQVAVLAFILGFTLGLIGGFLGGWIDNLIGRMLDLVVSFPWILAALVIAAVFGSGLNTALFALVFAYVPVFARLTRSVVLSERALEYVNAAEVIGASKLRVMTRHLVPNAISPIIVVATSIMAYAVLAEAALSYLGLGAQPPSTSWGRMLTENSSFYMTQPYLALFPGLAISWLVLALNLLGEGLRDYLDPRQTKLVK